MKPGKPGKPAKPMADPFAVSRRDFMGFLADHGPKLAIAGIGLTGLGVWGVQSYRERSLRRKLLDDAMPILTQKALQEQQDIPVQGKSEIKRYFDGVCLNVHRFVQEICSEPFLEQLWSYRTDEQQHNALIVAFDRNLVGDTQILGRVEWIASNLGRSVDYEWLDCCTQFADSWNVYIRDYQDQITGKALLEGMEPLITAELEDARRTALGLIHRPALDEIEEGQIGKSAILLLQIQQITQTLFLPVFCVTAMHQEFDAVVKALRDKSPHFQFQICQQIASLGNRVGAGFEEELTVRVRKLQDWQENALRVAASQRAHETISWFA